MLSAEPCQASPFFGPHVISFPHLLSTLCTYAVIFVVFLANCCSKKGEDVPYEEEDTYVEDDAF